MEKLGFYSFLDQTDDLENEVKKLLYDYREDKLYTMTNEDLEKAKENILSYAKFRMNELLAGKEVVKDAELIAELRRMGFIPPLQQDT